MASKYHWEWKAQDDSWHFFSHANSQRLELSLANGERKVEVLVGSQRFIVNLHFKVEYPVANPTVIMSVRRVMDVAAPQFTPLKSYKPITSSHLPVAKNKPTPIKPKLAAPQYLSNQPQQATNRQKTAGAPHVHAKSQSSLTTATTPSQHKPKTGLSGHQKHASESQNKTSKSEDWPNAAPLNKNQKKWHKSLPPSQYQPPLSPVIPTKYSLLSQSPVITTPPPSPKFQYKELTDDEMLLECGAYLEQIQSIAENESKSIMLKNSFEKQNMLTKLIEITKLMKSVVKELNSVKYGPVLKNHYGFKRAYADAEESVMELVEEIRQCKKLHKEYLGSKKISKACLNLQPLFPLSPFNALPGSSSPLSDSNSPIVSPAMKGKYNPANGSNIIDLTNNLTNQTNPIQDLLNPHPTANQIDTTPGNQAAPIIHPMAGQATSTQTPPVDPSLSAQYFIPYSEIKPVREIGTGAYGKVYEAVWQGKQVALKIGVAMTSQMAANEIKLMFHLPPHQNIVRPIGYTIDSLDSMCVLIEFCNQGSLNQWLNKANPPYKKQIDVLLDIAKGVRHLHQNSVIHRDLAARNILLHNDEAKVGDLGLSKQSQSLNGTTKSGIAPVRWMPPESFQEGHLQYSTHSDSWMFGMVVYEVVTRMEPHANADMMTIGMLIRDQGVTPEIPENTDPFLVSLMKRCWALNPIDRPELDWICDTLSAHLKTI